MAINLASKYSAKVDERFKLKSLTEAATHQEVGSEPCRSVSQGVAVCNCLPKTAWPPTFSQQGLTQSKEMI